MLLLAEFLLDFIYKELAVEQETVPTHQFQLLRVEREVLLITLTLQIYKLLINLSLVKQVNQIVVELLGVVGEMVDIWVVGTNMVLVEVVEHLYFINQ